MAETRDRIKQDAERRRNLEGNTLFQDLGAPIQALLQAVTKDITNEEMKLFTKVSVRLLTKVFNMMDAQEDPDKILLWLQQEAKLAQQSNKSGDNEIKRIAASDPIAFYRELEKKNQQMLESFKKAEEDRERERKEALVERERRRKEAEIKAEEDRKRADKHGDTTEAVDRLKKEDLADLNGAFDRFTQKQSTFDNSNSVQDTEWWKKDEFRRDYEKNKRKGKLWTRVIEGGTQVIPDSEMAAREEWYKSYCWWKADKFRRDWLASREAEWWKEETYIKEWQDKGDKGSMWLAADETTGFNKKGHRRPAAKAELQRRIDWYKNNGPKGIVKLWCALSEGSSDRCTLEEKRERDDYYKNGDWWKADIFVRKGLENLPMCDALRYAGAAAEDREWWKEEEFRIDFIRDGKKWKLASQKSAVTGDNNAIATEAEIKRREQWFQNNWWKNKDCINDFMVNGEKGTKWRAANEAELAKAIKNPNEKINLCSAADIKMREDWFRSNEDSNWWKDEIILRDWEMNGKDGKKWMAAWHEAAFDSTGDKNRASDEEIKKRDDYFKKNWWKTNKYVKDFQSYGDKGIAWKAQSSKNNSDKDWWKSADIQKSWLAASAADITPFWKKPEMVEDYLNNGALGKKWCAANIAAASVGIGDKFPATPEELAKREAFYKDNWWRALKYERDFAANGKRGKLWKAANLDGNGVVSNDEIRRRREFYSPASLKKYTPPFHAMLESDAIGDLGTTVGNKYASWEVRKKREDFYKKNWWKLNPAVRADYEAYGDASTLLKSATPEAAHAGLGGDPAYQASAAEIKERKAFFDSNNKDENDQDNWWKDSAYLDEWVGGHDVLFWKNPEYIQDFLVNGKNGKKWNAANAAAAAAGKGDAQPASADELAQREDFYKKHFWHAPKYQEDFEKNGAKGTLWTMTEPNGKGQQVTEGELAARQAWFRPNKKWQLAEKTTDTENYNACDAVEAMDRDQWFRKNWWKCPEVRDDYYRNGTASKLLKAANPDVINLGLQNDVNYQASADEVKERINYFDQIDDEWWKAPAVIADYVKWDKEGAVWQSRNSKESQLSMGVDNPASEEDLKKRTQWYEKNYWKTPEAVKDYHTNGNKGNLWKADRNGKPITKPDELTLREAWFKANNIVDTAEEARRKNWFMHQLTDDETTMRRNWIIRKGNEAKRIHKDELPDLMTQINDGHRPTDSQVQAILDAVKKYRWDINNGEGDCEVGDDGITQEEFVHAVAATNFYMSATDEERLRAEQEALDALQREEMERQDEVAGHLAMEAQEEIDNAGGEGQGDGDDEEAAFMEEMEEEDAGEYVNEDDAADDGTWQKWVEGGQGDEEGGELTEEQLAALKKEREAAESAKEEAEAGVWESEEVGGDEDENDAAENEADLDDEAKEQLEDVIDEDYEDEEEEEEEEEEELDEMQMEEKGQPMQWKLPLREVTNPQYLKAYFTVIKYTPTHSLIGSNQKRVWVVDHFTRCFYNLEKNGKIKKEHAANKLLQLERHVSDPTRLRLMFFDSSHSYELQFFNARERERFYESASSIRPSIRVYAPDLTNQDENVEACTTTIDGVGIESVSVTCINAQGKPVNRELTGECKINASKLITEPLTIWCGTFNLSGARPPKDKKEMHAWMPKDKYDIYAVAVQEASYRKEENEWFDYIQAYLGREYLTLASMNLWDTLLIVLTRKRHLLKITNVEGSTKATVHKAVCGTKGGIGIAIRYLETSMCFVTCHLAARIERTVMRNTNIEEIIDNLQLGIRETDICNQFNHVFFFGDLNYRIEVDSATSEKLMQEKKYGELLAYDQFSLQHENEGVLYGFTEPPITFAPTYRLQPGTGRYMIEKGNASSYCDRVVTRSMTNTWVKCTSYKSLPQIVFSEHSPVCASFIIRCVRPVLSCFMKKQKPIPSFVFNNINVEGNTNPVISRPTLTICSPFFGRHKPLEAKAHKIQNPTWTAAEIPHYECITQVQEFIETGHIIFIIREAAEKHEEKAHRGSGTLALFDRVIDKESVTQTFSVDMMLHGRRCGKITGEFSWIPSK